MTTSIEAVSDTEAAVSIEDVRTCPACRETRPPRDFDRGELGRSRVCVDCRPDVASGGRCAACGERFPYEEFVEGNTGLGDTYRVHVTCAACSETERADRMVCHGPGSGPD